MSLISTPFVGTGADTTLHVVAAIVLICVIVAGAIGLWKIHELPINHAEQREHRQMGLVTMLTWIGFIWHWVWVIAIIVAFMDVEGAILRIRDIWKFGEVEPLEINDE
ncbi:MFS transporter [uncultured Vibrio sp.]|uniref:MFS transporter n=1 Tax=uncultured Vibrio sp. TaxID=114054 RepID=UPI0025CE5FA7|nr:MFS transporter [uncultured Vibrio sp.]